MKKMLSVVAVSLIMMAIPAFATDDGPTNEGCTVGCDGAYYQSGFINVGVQSEAWAEGKWTETMTAGQFMGSMKVGDFENTQNSFNLDVMGGYMSENYGQNFSYSGGGAIGTGFFEGFNRW